MNINGTLYSLEFILKFNFTQGNGYMSDVLKDIVTFSEQKMEL